MFFFILSFPRKKVYLQCKMLLLHGYYILFSQAGYGILQFFNIRLHIPSPTMLSVALIILPVLQEVYAQGYHLPSIFYNIQTKRFNGPVGVHCLLLS